MKKIFLICTLFFTLQAQALVGVFGGGPAVALAGLGTAGVGFFTTILEPGKGNPLYGCSTSLFCWTGTYMMMFGIIALDENTGKISFNELTFEDKVKLGLSNDQFNSFNDEREEINSLIEEVAGRVNDNATLEEAVEQARISWSKLKDGISEDAFIAAQIIVDHKE